MLTKKRVLKETRELFAKIGEATEKMGMLVGKDYILGPWQNYLYKCPCCEFDKQFHELTNPLTDPSEIACTACPMWKQWGGCETQEECHYHCEERKSPYFLWMYDTDNCLDSAFRAYLVAELAGEALDELTNEEEGGRS